MGIVYVKKTWLDLRVVLSYGALFYNMARLARYSITGYDGRDGSSMTF
jgi:hypothetical protein